MQAGPAISLRLGLALHFQFRVNAAGIFWGREGMGSALTRPIPDLRDSRVIAGPTGEPGPLLGYVVTRRTDLELRVVGKMHHPYILVLVWAQVGGSPKAPDFRFTLQSTAKHLRVHCWIGNCRCGAKDAPGVVMGWVTTPGAHLTELGGKSGAPRRISIDVTWRNCSC